MPNPENIRPPKPGEVRNPKGKPPGTKNRSTILKKWIEVATKLKNPVTGKDEFGTVEDKVTLALIARALTGDVQAIKEINDTLYGKLTEKSEVNTTGDIVIKLIKGGSSK
jgi:hypothetical protein